MSDNILDSDLLTAFKDNKAYKVTGAQFKSVWDTGAPHPDADYIVQRGDQRFSCQGSALKGTLKDGDLMTVWRENVLYKVAYVGP